MLPVELLASNCLARYVTSYLFSLLFVIPTSFKNFYLFNQAFVLSLLIKHLKKKKWIHHSQKVLERSVTFVENTDEAEICLVDEDKDGDIISIDGNRGNNKVWY